MLTRLTPDQSDAHKNTPMCSSLSVSCVGRSGSNAFFAIFQIPGDSVKFYKCLVSTVLLS